MAAVVVQSRFAGLNIEDDDYPPTRDEQKKKKPIPVAPASTAKKIDPAKKKTAAKTQTATQTKKKKSKSSVQTSEQWEQWKQKDEELVDGNFEDELHQAILLSKLDYEQKKDVYKQIKKETEIEQKAIEQAAKNNSKKHKKKKDVMSLDQFNDMVAGGEQNRLNHEPENETEDQKQPSKDSEFFERIKHETKNELLKDKIIDRVKNRSVASDEVITRGQFADALEKKDIEIETLKQQVQSLKEELLAVKSRNKKLCNILGQGEMRDKAQVLVEVEKLRGVQAELTAEVQALHGELERERSRNMDARTRDKKKKAVSVEKEK